SEQIRALDGKLPDGTAAPDRNRVSLLDLTVCRGQISRREDVREKQHLFVGQRTWDLQGADISEGHADELSLAPSVAAVHMGIAKESRCGEAIELLRHPCIGIRVVAQRPQLFLAEVALPASNGEWNDDAIANAKLTIASTDLDHLAHEFMAEHVTWFHCGYIATVDVKVGSADRGCRDSDDCIARIEDPRIGNCLDAHVLFSVVADGLHCRAPSASSAELRAISPASRNCLSRLRSSRMVCAGSCPKIEANALPGRPNGAAYCR